MASTTLPTPKQFRYSHETDVALLREAVSVNPFIKKMGIGWHQIWSNLLESGSFPSHFTSRSARERTNLLMERYRKERIINGSSSGIVEEASEKRQLLEELLHLKEEAHHMTSILPSPALDLGQWVRDPAISTTVQPHVRPQLKAEAVPEEPSESDDSVARPVSRLGKKRKGEEGHLWPYYVKARQVNRRHEREWKRDQEKEELELRRKEIEFMKERDERDREERRQEAERQREKEEYEREERREEAKRQREREEYEREERRQEAARQREREENDREERRQEIARQQEREKYDREERRQEAARQRERDENERQERRQLLDLLIAAINKK